MQFLNIHDLSRNLNKLCESLKDIYDINYGGCCYISYLIAFHLDKLSIKYDLIIYDNKGRNETQMNKEILHMTLPCSTTGNDTCNHYCIKIKGAKIINNEFYHNEVKYIIRNINSKHIKWIYKHGKWNRRYDINNNKYVKGIFNSFFLKYETRKN